MIFLFITEDISSVSCSEQEPFLYFLKARFYNVRYEQSEILFLLIEELKIKYHHIQDTFNFGLSNVVVPKLILLQDFFKGESKVLQYSGMC